jgi:CBS domain containing-hemolysin-like protein
VLLILNGIFSMSELAIVTAKRVRLENILSGLIGSSFPDRGPDAPRILQNSHGSWTADGGIDMDRVEEAIGLSALEVVSRRGYRTLAGFLMTRSGRVLHVGDVVTITDFAFRVELLDGRRIERVRSSDCRARSR